ncbi:MAG: hydroxysqualene dehydroxylase HpnE [Planctomycetota bacterium]
MPRNEIIIIGAGLAGLSAACHLVTKGARVTALERRPIPGGRVWSLRDETMGDDADNAPHVFTGACAALIGFLKKVNAWPNARLARRGDYLFVDERGGRHRFRAAGLPATFQYLPALLRFTILSFRERLGILRAMGALRRMGPDDFLRLDGMTLEAWLRNHNQTDETIRNFWNVFCIATMNASATRASAGLALRLLREAFFTSREAANLGWAVTGLTAFLAPAETFLRERGGNLRLRTAASGILVENRRAAGVRTESGEILRADTIILAVPPHDLPALLPEHLREDAFFTRFRQFAYSPIIGIHLWYDREFFDFDAAACLGGDLQWIFVKSRAPCAGAVAHISLVLSAADEWLARADEEIIRRLTDDIGRRFPESRGAKLLHTRIIREPRATFLPAPGTGILRPSAETPVSNLFIAGAWTDTGWPATMEGAVRSGERAAEMALKSSGIM